jgi:plasmid stabilization system protein ParE
VSYQIEISSVAEAEIDAVFLRLSQAASPDSARQWHDGLLKAIASLSTMPNRCAIARENEYFSQEIRQLLYGKNRNAYRILFTVLEEFSTVRIPHVRNSSQSAICEALEDL